MMRQAMFLWTLLMVSTCFAFEFKCPLKEDIMPCSCYRYTIYCEENGTTPQQLATALSSLKGRQFLTLYISEMDMSDVPFSIFQDLQFSRLQITYSTLKNFTDTGESELEGLRQQLDTIEIAHSIGNDFRLNVSSFKNLDFLDISNNDLEIVKKEWFEDTPSSLKSLTLYKNNIEKLEDGAFFEMTQLEKLELSTNHISEIKRNMFPGPGNNMRSLHIDYNKITTIPEDFFTDMDSLKTLNLRFNRIEVLPRRIWSSIWERLESLHLYGNRLKCDLGIEWMFYVPRPDNLSAKCYLPKEHRGKDLNAFIDENAEDERKTQL